MKLRGRKSYYKNDNEFIRRIFHEEEKVKDGDTYCPPEELGLINY